MLLQYFMQSAYALTEMQASSPFTDYTASVVTVVLLIGGLVVLLLGGGLLVLNIGLFSKRREDRVGGRTPSDLGVLRNMAWPEDEDNDRHLPAEEPDEERKIA